MFSEVFRVSGGISDDSLFFLLKGIQMFSDVFRSFQSFPRAGHCVFRKSISEKLCPSTPPKAAPDSAAELFRRKNPTPISPQGRPEFTSNIFQKLMRIDIKEEGVDHKE